MNFGKFDVSLYIEKRCVFASALVQRDDTLIQPLRNIIRRFEILNVTRRVKTTIELQGGFSQLRRIGCICCSMGINHLDNYEFLWLHEHWQVLSTCLTHHIRACSTPERFCTPQALLSNVLAISSETYTFVVKYGNGFGFPATRGLNQVIKK